MTEYYLDIETTEIIRKSNGTLDFDKMEIVTIQYQKLNSLGIPIEELHILKRWENSEENILRQFYPFLTGNKYWFIFIGKNNRTFDLKIIENRLKHYGFETDYDDRICIDLDSLCILMNNGSLKGWNEIIPNNNTIINKEIPILFKNKEYEKIESYIRCEAEDFLTFYAWIKQQLSIDVKETLYRELHY